MKCLQSRQSGRYQVPTYFPYVLYGFFVLLGSCLAVAGVEADELVNPCLYKDLDPEKYGGKPFQSAPEKSSTDGTWNGRFAVEYGKNEIAGCPTRLRSYDGRLVGTTIRVHPGDTIKLMLDNLLPLDPTPMPDDMNTPHNFNVTNFHTHGLHVSPSGQSDNVLIKIEPQTSWDVKIDVPKDHPTGTFWYHAHVHGSTAMQVSSGMVGAIIIEDDKSKTSLDSIPEIAEARDQLLLLQQTIYDEQGVIESYPLESWRSSKRHPLINGQLMPEIVLQPGEVRRWRFIHGGIKESFFVAVRDTDLPPGDAARWDLHEIAVDGLSLGWMETQKIVELQPGYRSDVLVKAPALPKGQSEKVYYMMDEQSDSTRSLMSKPEAQQILAKIIVRGPMKPMKLPCGGKSSCEALRKTRPHKNITDEEIKGTRTETVEFRLELMLCPVAGEKCKACPDETTECKWRYMINDIPYWPENIRELTVGTASEWKLSSVTGSHPFHIHVNPFQVTRRVNGKDQIIWRDTLLVRHGEPQTIRSRYERYTGKFVIHCHILDHEDQGMMQIVEIVEASK